MFCIPDEISACTALRTVKYNINTFKSKWELKN